jgi:DNA-directed RNA polymerase specialized sigma subunit
MQQSFIYKPKIKRRGCHMTLLLLLRQAKSGDKAAMEKIVELYMPLVIKYSKGENSEINEDCMQHLIVNLISAVKRFSTVQTDYVQK